MERTWTFAALALTLAETDFLDPALPGDPGDRERGVRLEVRPLHRERAGSVYASDPVALAPAVCRIDLLESAPGAADRMHWHPVVDDGEPGERVFDAAIPADPTGWLGRRLEDLGSLLTGVAEPERARLLADAGAVAAVRDEVVAVADAALARLRAPWPETAHDERGMAVAGPATLPR